MRDWGPDRSQCASVEVPEEPRLLRKATTPEGCSSGVLTEVSAPLRHRSLLGRKSAQKRPSSRLPKDFMKQLDLPHTSFALLPKFDAGKPGSETGINLKAGMRLKYMGNKSRLAPHVDRLLGDVGAILCVAQEWLGQSCCLRRIEAAILCPTQDCQARTRPAPGPHQARTRQLEAWARNPTSVWSPRPF